MYFIEEFYLEGYRSFDSNQDHGIAVKGLKNINVFIGPNNSGKSNIMRFFMQVNKEINKEINKEFNEEGSFFNNKDFNKKSKNKKIFAHLKIKEKSENPIILINENEVFTHSHITRADMFQLFQNHTYFIGTNRDHSATKLVNEYDYLTPNELPRLWSILNHGNFITSMNRWLTEILGEEAEVYFDPKEEDVIKVSLNGFPYEITELGSGVEQVLQILANIYYKDSDVIEGKNIFIEEPEAHLHPKALIKLMELFQTDEILNKHRYFIFSHSNSLLDCMNDDWSIYWVWKEKDTGTTRLTQCENRNNTYELLDSIGVRPSQLLQSNLVIWVEGPSDRIYINKWIAILSENKYIEGRHYSFMMYGGSLIYHYGIFNEHKEEISYSNQESKDLIDILSTSRFAVVVADRDREDQESPLKPRLEKLKVLIDGMEKSNRIKLWTTFGREIENYNHHSVLCDVCLTFKKERIDFKGKTIKLGNPEEANLNNEKFSESHSFDEFFSQLFLSSELLLGYSETEAADFKKTATKKISTIFKKIDVAKKVVEKIGSKDDIAVELKRDIEPLLNLLREANGF